MEDLVGLMPANINNNRLSSHEGLTFGGVISDNEMKTPIMMGIFEKMIDHCREEGFTELLYKTVPYIYIKFQRKKIYTPCSATMQN